MNPSHVLAISYVMGIFSSLVSMWIDFRLGRL